MLSILSGILTLFAYVPYVRAILRRETIPNSVSWWIWGCTGLILASTYYATGSTAALGLAIGATAGQILTALLSLKYGTGKPGLMDLLCIAGAVAALLVWYFTHDALLPHLMTVAMDFFAWLPTFRKTLAHPGKEDRLSWMLWTAGAVIALTSATQWTVAEVTYPVYVVITDSVVMLLTFRKR